MEIIGLWLLSGFIGAALGSGKNCAGTGFILGVLLGPIGWVIMICMNGNRRECPACRSKIHKEATICPQCRSDLNPNARAALTADLPPLYPLVTSKDDKRPWSEPFYKQ